MPQARAADTLPHLFLLPVRTARLMHLDDCGLTPHAHVAQIGGGQVEPPGFVSHPRLLRGRQIQPRVGGQLRMVKITPARGAPCYLYDRDGDGALDRDQADDIPQTYWKLFSW